MRTVARIFWMPAHVVWSFLAVLYYALARRRGVLVFTHDPDVDAGGRDRQMGPLVDGLLARRERVVEVTLVPWGFALFRNLANKRRPFVSHGAILGIAWLLGSGIENRTRVASWLLRILRPRALFLIDESGSGQPLVRAARRLGIRTVGVQHGDFVASPQYTESSDLAQPVDAFCVWSAWFRQRLLEVSPIYDEANTCVTGRLRYRDSGEHGRATGRRQVLVLGERPPHGDELERFVAPLVAHGIRVELRPHPALVDRLPSLARALGACDVALGRGSSALFEALWERRPIVVCLDDAVGIASLVGGTCCAEPGDIVPRVERAVWDSQHERVRDEIWGGAPEDPVQAVLSAGHISPPTGYRREETPPV